MSVVYIVLEDFRGLSMSLLCGNSSRSMRSGGGVPGRPCAATPHLDRLAREGVYFDRAYAQSPICNPSRTSAMTGRYPSTTGVLSNDDPPGFANTLPNLPQLLQGSARGRIVTTSPYSKVFHRPAADVPRALQPWDRSWWNRSNWRAVPSEVQAWLRGGAPPPRKMRGPGYGHVVPDAYHHMAFRRSVGILGALLAQREPFFYAFGISGTHTPLVPPKRFVDMYSAEGVALAGKHAPHAPLLARKDGFQSFALSELQQREYIATYLAAAQYVDAQVRGGGRGRARERGKTGPCRERGRTGPCKREGGDGAVQERGGKAATGAEGAAPSGPAVARARPTHRKGRQSSAPPPQHNTSRKTRALPPPASTPTPCFNPHPLLQPPPLASTPTPYA